MMIKLVYQLYVYIRYRFAPNLYTGMDQFVGEIHMVHIVHTE